MKAIQLSMNSIRRNVFHTLSTQATPVRVLLSASLAVGLVMATGCSTTGNPHAARAIVEPTVVEAACGQCLLGKKGTGCDLAIRIEGKSYFVDGVNFDALGDAHAKDGMCNVIRRAKVTGVIRNQRFAATSFVMLPAVQ